MTLGHHALANRIEIGQAGLPQWGQMKRFYWWMVNLGERNSGIPQWQRGMPDRI